MENSSSHIELMEQSGKILNQVIKEVINHVRIGVSGLELDKLAENLIIKSGGKPAFKYFQGFPATLCLSFNDQIVHGIPSKRQVRDGDLISIDAGVNYHGAYTDSATTIWLNQGRIITVDQLKTKTNLNKIEKLMISTYKSLQAGISQVKPGNNIGQISQAIQNELEKNGLGVIRDLVGHGVGHAVHEKPNIPNFGKQGDGPVLETGQTIAIEPMATTGDWRIRTESDNWTVRTLDGSLSAHFEHTVLVTDKGHRVLT